MEGRNERRLSANSGRVVRTDCRTICGTRYRWEIVPVRMVFPRALFGGGHSEAAPVRDRESIHGRLQRVLDAAQSGRTLKEAVMDEQWKETKETEGCG